jgi:transposase
VKGVGPITALAYVLTLENPKRFAKSRDVGPYLGLVPKQEDWGESQPQLGISKAGDTMVRKLLVGSAQYILGPFGPDTDLRRYGLRLCERGGKNAKKRAAVAVARKLAVLLHRLWVSGEVYEPLHHAKSVPIAAAA